MKIQDNVADTKFGLAYAGILREDIMSPLGALVPCVGLSSTSFEAGLCVQPFFGQNEIETIIKWLRDAFRDLRQRIYEQLIGVQFPPASAWLWAGVLASVAVAIVVVLAPVGA